MDEHALDADAPPPVDAHEPPPRKRGLGRGLAELATSGRSIGNDGQPYYSLDSLMWSIDRAHANRVAERTPQPKALHRLPEPVDTGSLRVADILAAATDKPAPTVEPAPAPAVGPTVEPPKPRRMSEAAAMLVRGLPGMSEALREGEPAPAVVEAPEPEPVVVAAAAPEPVAPEPPRRQGKFAWLAEDDD